MKIIYRERQTGRTTELIEMAGEQNLYIVCRSQREAGRIFKQSKDMGLNISLPITFEEFVYKGYYSKGIKGFLIDNVDQLLQWISNVPVVAITLEKEK